MTFLLGQGNKGGWTEVKGGARFASGYYATTTPVVQTAYLPGMRAGRYRVEIRGSDGSRRRLIGVCTKTPDGWTVQLLSSFKAAADITYKARLTAIP